MLILPNSNLGFRIRFLLYFSVLFPDNVFLDPLDIPLYSQSRRTGEAAAESQSTRAQRSSSSGMQCTARPSSRTRAASRRPAADSGSNVGSAVSSPWWPTVEEEEDASPPSDTRAPLDDRRISLCLGRAPGGGSLNLRDPGARGSEGSDAGVAVAPVRRGCLAWTGRRGVLAWLIAEIGRAHV